MDGINQWKSMRDGGDEIRKEFIYNIYDLEYQRAAIRLIFFMDSFRDVFNLIIMLFYVRINRKYHKEGILLNMSPNNASATHAHTKYIFFIKKFFKEN